MIDKKPEIAVIIPVYNLENYVEDAVKSVLSQPYEMVQIVCVNDGSTDGSRDVLQKLQKEESRVHVIDQPNGGVSVARNTGIEYVLQQLSADYIMFLDGDDVWCKNWLTDEIVALMSRNYDVVCFDLCYADHSLQYRAPYEQPVSGVVAGGEQAYAAKQLSMSSNAYRAELLRRTGIRLHVGQKYGEDLCFLLETMSLSRECCFHAKLIYLYRDRPGSAVRRIIPAVEYYPILFDGWIKTHQFLLDHGFTSRSAYGNIKYYMGEMVEKHFRQQGSRKQLLPILNRYAFLLDAEGPEDQKARRYLEQFSRSYELKQRLTGIAIRIGRLRNKIPFLLARKNNQRYPIPVEGNTGEGGCHDS